MTRRAAAITVLAMLAVAAARRDAGATLVRGCAGREGDLARGEVVVVEDEPSGGAGVALHVCGVIDAPPAQVWAVLRDCGAYERFLPRVERSRLERRDGHVAVCEVVVDLPFPMGTLGSVTRVVETARADGSFERRWSLLRGTYRRHDGAWTVSPWRADARRTLAVYQVDTDPDTVVPDLLVRRLQARMARETFAALRARVGQCVGVYPPSDCGGN
jgi:ribosome-associated toxin RatA of RatAB toxin-antitoxin module